MTTTSHSSILLKRKHWKLPDLQKRVCYRIIRAVCFLKSIINISNYPLALEVVFFFSPLNFLLLNKTKIQKVHKMTTCLYPYHPAIKQ